MKIYVNEKKIILFNGARVRDALLMYDKNSLAEIEQGRAEVLDAFANIVGLDGALTSNSRLFFRTKKN